MYAVAGDAQSLGPQFDLLWRLLRRYIERWTFFRSCKSGNLAEYSRLSNSRLSAQQHNRSRHDAATQHTVKLAYPRRNTLVVIGMHLAQRGGRRSGATCSALVTVAGRLGGDDRLDQTIP